MKRRPLRSSGVRYTIVKACVVIMALLSPCIAGTDNESGPSQRLAILSSKEVQQSGLSDLLTVQLQERPGVELVERDLLQKVFNEIALTTMLGADQTENRRKAGALLKADMLVLLSLEKAEDKKNVRLVISDCSSGARLRIGWAPFNESKLDNTCQDLTKIVKQTLERFSDGVKQVIGVSYFVSKNFVHDYDHFQAAYANLLGNALSMLPGIAVIEIEEARSIRLESELAGDMELGRVVPLFVEGEFTVQKAASEEQPKVRMTIHISDGARVIKQIDGNDLSMDKVAEFITDDIGQEILKVSKSPSLKILDKEKQFTALVDRASEFASVGAWEQSTGLREAAVLVEPNSAAQRTKLVDEYCHIKKARWSFEHLEYMIYNRMISVKKAVELSWESFNCSGLPRKSYRREFLRTAYPEILKLEPSGRRDRREKEYGTWYELLGIRLVSIRYGSGCGDKDDLDFCLHVHENLLPEEVGASYPFILFLQDHVEPGWSKRSSFPHDGSLYFVRHPEHFSEQDFLDFITAMSQSKKPLASAYGQYALLYREYYKRQKQGIAMDDLLDEVRLFLSGLRKHRTGLQGETRKLREKIKRHIEAKRPQTKVTSREPASSDISSLPKKEPKPAAKSRLVFERVPMKCKTLFGFTIHAAESEVWTNMDEGGGMLRCGDSMDVMWSHNSIAFIKEKGLMEEVPASGGKPYFDDLAWDGRNVWVGTRRRGIWLLDTSGKLIATIGSEDGLPPAGKAMRLCPIEPGRMLAVGAFGPHGRAWCAVVEYRKGKASVDVFHEAVRVPTKAASEGEFARDPTVVFSPLWVHEYIGREKDNRMFLVGRDLVGRDVGSAPNARVIIRRYPLEINLNEKSVGILPYPLPRIRRLYTNTSMKWGSAPYFSRHGRFFVCGDKCVTCFSEPGARLPDGEKKKVICRKAGLARHLIEYDGAVYVPGKTWFRFNADTLQEEKLVQGALPNPYGALSHYWASAHYGLLGWSFNYGFFQIKIADEEQVYGHFHTFVFEDENGRITNRARLNEVLVNAKRKGNLIAQYIYDDFKNGDWFVPGTYKATMGGKNLKICKFEPVEVTADSPEELVFRARKRKREILYCGQVVNAITSKPMAGAFVMTGSNRNLAWITPEEWGELHKLPLNPSLEDEALWPVKNTSSFRIEQLVRTNADGRFAMKFRPDEIIRKFVVFEENYLNTVLSGFELGPAKNGRIELGPMPLFPAAKIVIEPCIEVYNSGRPCLEARNVGLQLRFISRATYRSKRESAFFNIYERVWRRPGISVRGLKMNLKQPFHVPAGFSFKMKFSRPFNDKWCIPDIPQTINLKQGETLDLGRFVFDPAIQIVIKAVDSAGNAVRHLAIRRVYDDRHQLVIFWTDEQGRIKFHVPPNSTARFRFGIPGDDPSLKGNATFQVDGKEDAGREFILLVPDNIVQHLSR